MDDSTRDFLERAVATLLGLGDYDDLDAVLTAAAGGQWTVGERHKLLTRAAIERRYGAPLMHRAVLIVMCICGINFHRPRLDAARQWVCDWRENAREDVNTTRSLFDPADFQWLLVNRLQLGIFCADDIQDGLYQRRQWLQSHLAEDNLQERQRRRLQDSFARIDRMLAALGAQPASKAAAA